MLFISHIYAGQKLKIGKKEPFYSSILNNLYIYS